MHRVEPGNQINSRSGQPHHAPGDMQLVPDLAFRASGPTLRNPRSCQAFGDYGLKSRPSTSLVVIARPGRRSLTDEDVEHRAWVFSLLDPQNMSTTCQATSLEGSRTPYDQSP